MPPNRFLARLRFFRAMLWVLMYACAGIFLMSLIILDGLRLQSKIIGAVLIVIVALIAATYGLQWHS
jgi:membrane protein DedA with SNARE-associated domain